MRGIFMIYNQPIDLSRNSEIRKEAINTIKYTFLLDYNPPPYDDDDTIIEDVMKSCQYCCVGLFNDYIQSYDFYYNFFGFSSLINKNQKYSEFQKIGVLPCEYFSLSTPHLHNFILQHCIISCYHAVLNDLYKDYELTSGEFDFSISKLKKFDAKEHKNKLSAGNFRSTLETHRAVIPSLATLSCEKVFLNTWIRICKIHSSYFKNVFMPQLKAGRKPSKTVLLKNILVLSDKLSSTTLVPSTNSDGLALVESIYQNYLFERLFDFRLFYSLLNVILHINSKTHFRIDQDILIHNLASCKSLPNTFSRQALLWYAVLHIDLQTDSNVNYWNKNTKAKEYDYLNNRIYQSGYVFDFYQWSFQFRLFCDYLSEYIIPIYEWCFTGMLLDTIESKYGFDGNEANSHELHLLRAKELLEDYIVKNYNILTKPFPTGKDIEIHDDMINTVTGFNRDPYINMNIPSKNMDFVILNKLAPTKGFSIENIPDDIFDILFDLFFSPNLNSTIGLSGELNRRTIINSIKGAQVNGNILTETYRDLFRRKFNHSLSLSDYLTE